MKKILNLGFVGAGFNGQLAHLKNYSKINQCKIIAIAEPRQKLRKLVAKKYNIPNQYATHYDLIKNEKNLDGVIVVTKRNMTGPIALDLLKNNFSIITEKPMTSNFDQAKKIINAIRNKEIIYQIGYNKIHDKGILEAKKAFDKIIKTNELGKITLIRSHRSSGTGYAGIKGDIKTNEINNHNKPSWKSKPTWLPNKYLNLYEKYLNLYCHNINLIRYFAGNNLKVVYSSLSEKKMSHVIMTNKKYDIILETGFFGRDVWDECFEIYFEFGSLKISLPPQHDENGSASYTISNLKNKKYYYKKNKWSFYYQALDFVETIKNKRKNYINSGKDALNDMKIVEEIWKKYIN